MKIALVMGKMISVSVKPRQDIVLSQMVMTEIPASRSSIASISTPKQECLNAKDFVLKFQE